METITVMGNRRREADAGECFNAHGESCQINVPDVMKTDNS